MSQSLKTRIAGLERRARIKDCPCRKNRLIVLRGSDTLLAQELCRIHGAAPVRLIIDER